MHKPEFERLRPPQPGEWRYYFDEAPQTFEDYVIECTNRRGKRSTIYLVPLGSARERWGRTLETLRTYAEVFFDCPAWLTEPRPLPKHAYKPRRRQYHSSAIIDWLAPQAAADALIFAGIADQDLFADDLNFVFGTGSFESRCGVYSLVRLESADPTLFLRRALKLMSHEFGHILCMRHCVEYRCLMNGSNSLEEADARPMNVCPIDLRKLQWNLGFDVETRYNRLERFFQVHGLS